MRNTVIGQGTSKEEATADLVIRYGYQFGSAPTPSRIKCWRDDDGWTCAAEGFDVDGGEKGSTRLNARKGKAGDTGSIPVASTGGAA